jgi:hypothetical protein
VDHGHLVRVVYAGYVEAPKWGISLRNGQHEPLISFETYKKIQDRLSANAKTPKRKRVNLEFALTEKWWPGAESNHRHADFQSVEGLCRY